MLKQTLLAFTVLGFAGSAAAADITNPFFLPESLHVSSVTSASFSERDYKDKNWFKALRTYTKAATEQLAFGVLNNLAVIGSLAKDWNKEKDREGTFDTWKYKNDLDWTAGLAWNILHCNTKLQLSSVYGQITPNHWSKGTYKFFDTEVKFGYQFKTVLPYATFGVHTPVAQTTKGYSADRVFNGKDRWNYNGKIGLYQGKCGVWALDTALAVDFNRQSHSRRLTAEAEASYYLTKNATLGIYGSYLLDAHVKSDPKVHEKTAGARLRLYF